MPVRNGSLSDDAPDRHRKDGALRPALAAAVALLVPPPELPGEPVLARVLPLPLVRPLVIVLLPVAPVAVSARDPLVVDELPLLLGADPVPVLMTEPMP